MVMLGAVLAISPDPKSAGSSFFFTGAKEVKAIIEHAPNTVMLRGWLHKLEVLIQYVSICIRNRSLVLLYRLEGHVWVPIYRSTAYKI